MIETKRSFESRPLKEKYCLYRHSCGLDIYIFPKKMTSTYALFGTKYGSVDSRFGIEGKSDMHTVPDGIAHFLEHKLFANEDGSDSFERFSDFGADANAYTSFNKTAYLFSCTDRFEDSFRELIGFVGHPYFTDESVSRERGIIAQEIRMYDDSPADRCFYGMLEGLYEHNSIRRNICGTVESIGNITPEMLYDCYNVFYNPSNMALIVVGDVEPETVLKIAEEELPGKCADVKIIRADENKAEKRESFVKRTEQKMNVSKPMFCIGIKDTDIPADGALRQRKDAQMSILDEMLFSRAGEFYNSLLEREMISPSFSYGYTISAGCAYNSLAGESDDPDAVLCELKKYLQETAKKGLSREDFDRAKKVMYSEYVKLFDSTESIANTLFSFVCEDASLFDYDATLKSVRFEDVCALFGRCFDDECFTLSIVSPADPGQ